MAFARVGGRGARARLRSALALLAAATWPARPGPARAQALASGPLPIVAMRSESALGCPDSTGLRERVRALRPEAPPEGLEIEIRFDREGQGYVATVQTAGRLQTTRVLHAPGPECEGLADATAVSVSLLLDLLPDPPPASPPPPSPAPNSPPAPPKAPLGIWFALGGGFSWQLPSRAGGFATTEALIAPLPPLLFGLGGALSPTAPLEKGEAAVEVDLRFAFARACWVFGSPGGVRAGGCALPAVGRLRGRGQGYALDREANRPWFALGGGVLAAGPLAGPVGWLAESTAFAPLGRESFSVEGLGRAYRTPPVGVLTSAALTVQIH